MQSRKIILLCMASAVLYGNCHDQVTARVCVEYFTIGHTPPFQSESPTLLALFFGTMATWWVGLILGVVAALACRAGRWPKLDAAHLVRPIVSLLIVMAVASILGGTTGYRLADSSSFALAEPYGSRVSESRHHLFFADTLAHVAAYGVGFLGGIVLCAGVLVHRYRSARALPDDETACTDLLRDPWIVVTCRWTARTISIPLFVLLVLFTPVDGMQDLLVASQRVWLFVVVDLMVLFGLILAWRWEGVGGLLILGGLILFAAAGEAFLLNIVFMPWLVTGLAYLVCWVVATRLRLA